MTDYRIWDPLVRVFHWSLVAGFAANALILEEDSKLHEWVGYAVLALVGVQRDDHADDRARPAHRRRPARRRAGSA